MYVNQTDLATILQHVWKRTIYTLEEIEAMTTSPILVILFKVHAFLRRPVQYAELTQMGIAIPQTINLLNHDKCIQVKTKGGVDERLAFH